MPVLMRQFDIAGSALDSCVDVYAAAHAIFDAYSAIWLRYFREESDATTAVHKNITAYSHTPHHAVTRLGARERRGHRILPPPFV